MADRMGALAALDEYEEAAQPYRGFPRLDAGQGGGFRAPGSGVSPEAQALSEMMIPQTPLDFALMASFGPGGKVVAKAAGPSIRAGARAMSGVLGLTEAQKMLTGGGR